MEALETVGDAIAALGHNNPPALSPFETVQAKINDLYAEAKQWLDGEPVTTQGQADALNALIVYIRAAEKEADELRKDEAKPHDEAKAEIQSRYNALIGETKTVKGLTVLAVAAAKKALTPWLEAQDAIKRERERIAREEAEAAQKRAQEALEASRATADLEAREQALRLADVAESATIAAKVASNDTAKAKGGSGRATTLRSFYSAEITDELAFGKWAWAHRKPEYQGFLQDLADKTVSQNHNQEIPGLKIIEERRAV